MEKRVLIPALKPENVFFDGIEKASTWQFHYGNLNTSVKGYAVVLIHWPEHLFNWQEPTEEQLNLLEQRLKIWQNNTRIVYMMHNEKRHYGMTTNFETLYKLVYNYCHAIVHLGAFSCEKYKLKYPQKTQVVIPHPLYQAPFKNYDKTYARQKLGIKPNQQVVIIPGAVRSLKERDLVLKAFNKLKIKNKLLLAPHMYYKKVSCEFPGRYRIRKYIDIKRLLEYIHNKEYNKKYRFSYGFVPPEQLSLLMAATDVVFIPRINSLNSGIVFLGMTFNKVVVGPEIGNISEVLHQFNLPMYNPHNISSVTKALNKAFQMYKNTYTYPEETLQNYHPKNVAAKWDAFLQALCNNPLHPITKD